MVRVEAPLDVGEDDADEHVPEAARAELLARAPEVVHTPRIPPRAHCLVAAKEQYILLSVPSARKPRFGVFTFEACYSSRLQK